MIPEVNDMIREIVKTKPKDHFFAVVTVIEKLMKYKTSSPFMNELVENVKQDCWHGVNEDLPTYKGEFYINPAVD